MTVCNLKNRRETEAQEPLQDPMASHESQPLTDRIQRAEAELAAEGTLAHDISRTMAERKSVSNKSQDGAGEDTKNQFNMPPLD